MSSRDRLPTKSVNFDDTGIAQFSNMLKTTKSVNFDDTGIAQFSNMLKTINLHLPDFYTPIRSDKPILSPGTAGAWDQTDVHGHSVFRDWTGKYWLYYNKGGSTGGIGLAESINGYVFTKNGANPLLSPLTATWEADGLWKEDVKIIRSGGSVVQFKMWYGGFSGGYLKTGYAESSDGVSWTRYSVNPVMDVGALLAWDSKCVGDFRVVFDRVSGIYSALYYGKPSDISLPACIGLATSPDGKVWTKYAKNPVMAPLPNSWEEWEIGPKCIIDKGGGGYILFYEGTGSFNPWQIGIAYSTDLISWYRDSRNPIMGQGYIGDFDETFVADPVVIIEPDVLKIYYSSYDASNNGYVGLAIIPLKPKASGYFRTDWVAWNARVLVGAETSDMVTCAGYRTKTVNFVSDANGTLTISHREPDGGWQIYSTTAVIAGTPLSILINNDVEAIRVSFNNAGTITAWWEFTA